MLATTYQAMGLLPSSHRPNWYDAGRFWSGDHLGLSAGFRLGGEIAVVVPAGEPGSPQPMRPTAGPRGFAAGDTSAAPWAGFRVLREHDGPPGS